MAIGMHCNVILNMVYSITNTYKYIGQIGQYYAKIMNITEIYGPEKQGVKRGKLLRGRKVKGLRLPLHCQQRENGGRRHENGEAH